MPVSIIMPTYNRVHCITEAIHSIQNQSHQDWELIICDDCSTDNTETVISEYMWNDGRIKYHRNEHNLGLPENRNKGVELAKHNLILFWEDDVVMDKDAIEILIGTYQQLENSNIKVAVVSPKVISDAKKGKLISLETIVGNNMRSKLNKPSYISKWTGLIFQNFTMDGNIPIKTDVGCSWSLFNKSAIIYVGAYDGKLFGKLVGYSHEETDLFYRLGKAGYELYYQPKAVSYHKQSQSGGTRVKIVRYCWNYLASHILFLIKDFGLKSFYMIPLCFGYIGINILRYLPKLASSK